MNQVSRQGLALQEVRNPTFIKFANQSHYNFIYQALSPFKYGGEFGRELVSNNNAFYFWMSGTIAIVRDNAIRFVFVHQPENSIFFPLKPKEPLGQFGK